MLRGTKKKFEHGKNMGFKKKFDIIIKSEDIIILKFIFMRTNFCSKTRLIYVFNKIN
jgi:hypothetical protein